MGLLFLIGGVVVGVLIAAVYVAIKEASERAFPSDNKKFVDSLDGLSSEERALRMAERSNKQLRKDLHFK